MARADSRHLEQRPAAAGGDQLVAQGELLGRESASTDLATVPDAAAGTHVASRNLGA